MASTVWKLHHSTSFWSLLVPVWVGRISHLSQPCLASTLNIKCCVMRHAYTWWCLSRCVLHAVSRPMSPSKADCLATFFTFRTLEGCSNKNVFKKGLRDRNSPMCTLSQNGYGALLLSYLPFCFVKESCSSLKFNPWFS